ncbi:hypothetical protein AB0I69_28345 [Streptomyces sp. NPDC050508]|uniref:hypothetical protein n=1 Tax=Streptomyces sp. NPDC050508 TaxID=3155405 RepID=UPI0034273CDF
MTPVATSLDLDAIVAQGWVDSGDFTAAEFERARRFWHGIRAEDAYLDSVRAAAGAVIRRLTDAAWCDFGSQGLRLNLPGSDVDLGVGVKSRQWPRIRLALEDKADCLGVVRTPFGSSRLAFTWRTGESTVDLSVVTPDVYEKARRMLTCIDTGMERDERIRFTWVKQLLHASKKRDQYSAWKLMPYRRFCSGFIPFGN